MRRSSAGRSAPTAPVCSPTPRSFRSSGWRSPREPPAGLRRTPASTVACGCRWLCWCWHRSWRPRRSRPTPSPTGSSRATRSRIRRGVKPRRRATYKRRANRDPPERKRANDMDVQPNDLRTAVAGRPSVLGFDRLAQLLGGWQERELRAARGFPECRGLSHAQLEDLYQETALALLSRPYASEEHLRDALRHGIRNRALNMHRDQRRRSQILAEHAPVMHRTAQAGQTGPEDAALAQQD